MNLIVERIKDIGIDDIRQHIHIGVLANQVRQYVQRRLAGLAVERGHGDIFGLGFLFVDVLDGDGTDAGNGLGVSLPGPGQLNQFTWIGGIDTIHIEFSEDVSDAFTKVNLSLLGGRGGDCRCHPGVSWW